MAGRRSYSDEARTSLLGLWEGQDGDGLPVGVVCTTFTLEGAFFEEELLGRFLDMDTVASEDGASYLVEREEKLSQVFACVLADRDYSGQQRRRTTYDGPPSGHRCSRAGRGRW